MTKYTTQPKIKKALKVISSEYEIRLGLTYEDIQNLYLIPIDLNTRQETNELINDLNHKFSNNKLNCLENRCLRLLKELKSNF